MHELHEDDFEKLCTDLFSREPGIATCNPYGVRGQRQHGIDLLASVRGSGSHEVVQCKCYREFSKEKIKSASDEFFKHLAYWRERRVVRFVLIVAEPLAKTGQQQQIIEERRRFERVGIRYEAWSLHTLLDKLRPWHEIVSRYLSQRGSDYWVEHICGVARYRLRPTWPSSFGPATPTTSVEPAFAAIIELATEGMSRRLDQCRQLARKGLHTDAQAMIDSILTEAARVEALSPLVIAQALQLQASLALDRRDGTADAKRFIADAARLHNAETSVIEARIALAEQGPEACLALLDRAGVFDEAHDVLRGVCHLRAGCPASAIAVLEPWTSCAATADPARLLALAMSAAGRSAEALQYARAAVAREPDGWAARVALGVVLYHSAIAPLAGLGRIVDAPEPCDWSIVRRDDASVANLREAASIFALLLQDRQERVDRETLQAWRLACLLNDAERQADALAHCRTILQESITNPYGLEWALARALPAEGPGRVCDLAKARRALSDLLDAGGGDIRHLSVLLSLLAVQGQEAKIGRTLRQYRSRFVASDSADLFAALEVEAQLREGRAEPNSLSIDSDRAALLAALRASTREETIESLRSIAGRLAASSANDRVLVEALFRLGQMGDSIAVAPFARLLVAKVGTADAVRLAAYAQHAAGQHEAALATLDEQRAAFPAGELPRDLRRLRAVCLQILGRLDLAIAEMQTLRVIEPAEQDALRLADLFVRRGDLPQAAATIASLGTLEGIRAGDALRFARVLSRDDPEQAKRLWRHAVKQELDAPLLPVALTTARQLSLGPETAPVVQRMAAVAQPFGDGQAASPVLTLSMAAVVEFFKERQAEVARFRQLYETGTCPVHLLAPQLGWSLPRLFHEAPSRHAETGSNAGLLLAAHGGRQPMSQFPPSPADWRLHLDVTGLLMAAHLDILDQVERCFRPIRISSHLIPALLEMRSELLDADDQALAGARELVALIDSGRVGVVAFDDQTTLHASIAAVLAHCAETGAIGVFWAGSEGVDWVSAPVTNLSGLVAAMVRFGALSPDREADARAQLGTAGTEPPAGAHIPPGASFVFHSNTIESVAAAGLLEAACAAGPVFVDSSVVEELRRQLQDHTARAETAAWLQAIVARLNAGTQDQTYHLLPVSVPEVDDLGPRDLAVVSLLDLLRLPQADGNAVWCDDRALTAYSACGSAALVNVIDVLAALRHYGRLSAEDFYRRLLRLRAGGAAFLAPMEGELAFWLRRGFVAAGRFCETPELAAIRRYLARCLQREAILQLHPVPDGVPNRHGEAAFFMSWHRCAGETLRTLWADREMSEDRLAACSEWVLESVGLLRSERLPVLQPTAEGRRAILVATLSGLLCNGFLLIGLGDRADDRFAAYMTWITAAVIEPRLRADPALEQMLADALAQFLATDSTDRSADARLVRRHLTARFLDGLPDRLKPMVAGHTSLIEALELPFETQIIQIGPLAFPARPYLEAVGRALEGEATELREQGGDVFRLSVAWEDGQLIVSIAASNRTLVLADPIDVLMCDDSTAYTSLAANALWLDAPAADRQRHLDMLLRLENRADRLLKAVDLRASTAGFFYNRLHDEIGSGNPISFSDLEPPAARPLLGRLRLAGDGPFAERLSRAALELIADYGLDEAFARLGALPTPLPLPISAGLAALPIDDQVTTLRRWRDACPAPVHRIHIARESARLGGQIGDVVIRDELATIAATVPDEAWLTAFCALLRAFGGRSADWRGVAALSPSERILACWAHAAELLRIVGPAVDLGEFAALADRFAGESIVAAFCDDQAFRSDIACPETVHAAMLVLSGIAYVNAARPAGCLPLEDAAYVRKIATQTIDGVPFPQGWLLEGKDLRPNATESFLGAPLSDVVAAAGLSEVAQWCTLDGQHTLLRHGLETAGASEEGLRGWRMVLTTARFGDLTADWQNALQGAVGRTTGAALTPAEPLSADILRFLARQTERLRDKDLRAVVGAMFSGAIERVASDGPDLEMVRQMLRIAIDLSRDSSGAFQTPAFERACLDLSQAGPDAEAAVRRFVFQAIKRLPLALSERLWPLLISLRAL